jgi:hypothetical protein
MQDQEINFFDLLGINNEQVKEYTVRLNSSKGLGDNVSARYVNYKNGEDVRFEAHIGWHTNGHGEKKRNFHTPYVLQFVELRKHVWLFIGKYKIGDIHTATSADTEGTDLEVGNMWYELEEMSDFHQFSGRLVVNYSRLSGQTVELYNMANDKPNNNDLYKNMTVNRLLDSPFTGKQFTGIGDVMLSFSELKQVVERSDWQTALGSLAGVYLQTDLATGKHYVGSAYSQDGRYTGLFSRLVEYTEGNHAGGNEGLIKLVSEKGKEYIERNFRYSILEIFDWKTDKDIVIEREKHWKHVLDSQEHGYNEN